MAHFYGTVSGCAKTTATRRGHKTSGLQTTVASWQGAIRVSIWHDHEAGRDCYRVWLIDWPSANERTTLATGFLDGHHQEHRARPAYLRAARP
jgi:hypothetical protein